MTSVAYIWLVLALFFFRMLVSKSDVFDENSQPVKTGVLRFTFDPPLWKPSDAGLSSRSRNQSASSGGASATFHQELDVTTSTVTIVAAGLVVKVAADLNAPLRQGVPTRDAGIIRVNVTGADKFGLKVGLGRSADGQTFLNLL